jgi:predicted DNA-binding transcriptional regulator AlpA
MKQRHYKGVKGLLMDHEVDCLVPLSRTTRWRLRKLNPPQFPEPIKFGRKRVAYRAADIAAFVAGTWRPERRVRR